LFIYTRTLYIPGNVAAILLYVLYLYKLQFFPYIIIITQLQLLRPGWRLPARRKGVFNQNFY